MDGEYAFYAAKSGLTPKERFSLADHKYAYYGGLGFSQGGLQSREYAYFLSATGLPYVAGYALARYTYFLSRTGLPYGTPISSLMAAFFASPPTGTTVITNYNPAPSCEQATAGAVTIRTNLLTNPGAEGAALWGALSGAAVSFDTIEKFSGTQSFKAVCPGSVGAEGAGVSGNFTIAGLTFSGSIRVKATAGMPLRMYLRAGVSADDKTVDFNGTGNWDLIKVEGHVAPGTATNVVQILIRTRTASAGTIWADEALIELGTTVGAYFDGATPDALGIDYGWSGTAHASTSTLKAANIETKRNRVINPLGATVTGYSANNGGGVYNLTSETGGVDPGVTNIRVEWTTAAINTAGYVVYGQPVSTSGPVVNPNETISPRARFKSNMNIPTLKFRIHWFDAANAAISFVDSNPINYVAGTTIDAIFPTATAPANAAKYQMYFLPQTSMPQVGDYMSVTMLSDVTPFFTGATPPGGDFYYNWVGTAHASASIQIGIAISQWVANNSAVFLSLAEHSSGKAACGVNTRYNVVDSGVYRSPGGIGTWLAGMPIAGSVKVKAPAGATLRASIICVGGATGAPLVTFTGTGDWQTVNLGTGTYPAGATTEPYMFIRTDVAQAPFTFYIDEAILVRDTVMPAYFDGDTPNTSQITHAWTGAPHASTSTKTVVNA